MRIIDSVFIFLRHTAAGILIRTRRSVAVAIAAGFLLTGCAIPSVEEVPTRDVKVTTQGDPSTWIEQVQVWNVEGSTVITGRVVQQGYGLRVPGHLDVEYPVAGSKTPYRQQAELLRRKGLSRFLRMAGFRIELEKAPAIGGSVRLRYHGWNRTFEDEGGAS